MKCNRCNYRFSIVNSTHTKTLFLYGYLLADYPLTYTVLECLEHFCDGVGWGLVMCHSSYDGLTSQTDGLVTLVRPCGTRSFSTVLQGARQSYRVERGLS